MKVVKGIIAILASLFSLIFFYFGYVLVGMLLNEKIEIVGQAKGYFYIIGVGAFILLIVSIILWRLYFSLKNRK